MIIVERDEIPSISSVIIEGGMHSLGLVKDFRKNPKLKKFIPAEPERVSFSWVRLLPGQTLAVHSHPTSSMILICEGEGYCTGDVSAYLKSGSVVFVPPNYLHGFCGAGEKGFWALSIQFENLGLYENSSAPRVNFHRESDNTDSSLNLIISAHDFFMEDFKKNAFFKILQNPKIKDEKVLDNFLDNLQYFSGRFQGILKARLQSAQSDLEKKLAHDHMMEEDGHDTSFAKYRGNPQLGNIDDEIVALSDWFENEMHDDIDSVKIVLMHFVLEGSGQLAHDAVYSIVKHLPVGEHFRVHQEEDEEHFIMGVEALKKIANIDVETLMTALITGWFKLNRLCECMATSALVKKNTNQDTIKELI